MAPVHDRDEGEPDDGNRTENRRTKRARHGELESDHGGAEQQEVPSAPRIHVIPDGVVPKCRRYAKPVESVARNPPEEQRNRHQNEHGTERFHAS